MRGVCLLALSLLLHPSLAATAHAKKCFDASADLVAWWPFDETSGLVANEVISGLDGHILFASVSSPVGGFVGGPYGGAYHFGDDHAMGVVSVPNDPKLNLYSTTDFTIDAWISHGSMNLSPTVPSFSRSAIFEKRDQSGYGFYFTDDRHLSFHLIGGSSGPLLIWKTVNPIPPGMNTWRHVAVRLSRISSGTSVMMDVRFFVDGSPVPTALPNPFSTNLSLDVSNNAFATIGQIQGDLRDFNVDEVEVFNRALTNAEIALIYSQTKCKCIQPPPDLDAWYPLDDINGTELVLGNDATAMGTVSFPAGKVHGALDAKKGHMSVPHTSVLNQGLGDFSIDAWVKFQPKSDSKARHLIEKRKYVSNADVVGYIVYVWKNRFGLQLADGNHTNRNDTRVVTDSKWHHFAVTVDRDNPKGILFYLDGVPGAPRDPTSRQGNLDNTEPLTIGLAALDVQLDEVEFFDRVLMPTEIQAIFNAESMGKCR